MKFYCNHDAQKNSAIRFKSIQPYDEIGLKTGDFTVVESFPVKVDEGKKFYDILWLQDVFNFSISNRIHSALIQAGITGWRSYPLQIDGRDQEYWGIQVIGKAGSPIRPVEIGFTIGLNFDPSTWDGSDMFLMQGTYFTLFSERLHDLLVKLKTTNLKLEETSTMEWYSSRPA
jgi:hypothetical protein